MLGPAPPIPQPEGTTNQFAVKFICLVSLRPRGIRPPLEAGHLGLRHRLPHRRCPLVWPAGLGCPSELPHGPVRLSDGRAEHAGTARAPMGTRPLRGVLDVVYGGWRLLHLLGLREPRCVGLPLGQCRCLTGAVWHVRPGLVPEGFVARGYEIFGQGRRSDLTNQMQMKRTA